MDWAYGKLTLMSSISPLLFTSKTGRACTIRSASTADASSVLAMAKAVMEEQIFTLTSVEEFTLTEEQEAGWIEGMLAHPSGLILVAAIGDEVVGMLSFSNGQRKRIAHTGEFGLSVAKAYRDEGIGAQLVKSLLAWAAIHPTLEKVNLKVHATNTRAIALYRKLGFEQEGLLRNDIKYGPGRYVDSIVMGNLLK
jgi:RimJ/RimL family protein N-acetyltransferase